MPRYENKEVIEKKKTEEDKDKMIESLKEQILEVQNFVVTQQFNNLIGGM